MAEEVNIQTTVNYFLCSGIQVGVVFCTLTYILLRNTLIKAMTSFLLVTTYSCGKYSRASTCKLAEISQSFRCFAPRVFSIYRKSVHGQLSGSVVLSSCTNRLCFPSVTLAKRNLLLIINVPWERLCSVNIISHADYESAGAIFHLQLVVDPQSLMNGRLTSFRTLTQSKLLQSSSGIFVHIPSALH